MLFHNGAHQPLELSSETAQITIYRNAQHDAVSILLFFEQGVIDLPDRKANAMGKDSASRVHSVLTGLWMTTFGPPAHEIIITHITEVGVDIG